MVSVVMVTYNHAEYIIQAIEGVVMQKCDFEVELIIANDNSPDNTDDIIRHYLGQKTPPKNISIKYTKHEVNKGMSLNFTWALKQCSTKYIALCDGDDYWTDPYKLRKQIDFLENNPDFSLCFTNTSIVNDKGEVIKEKSIEKLDKSIFTHQDMPFFVPTLTRVFTNVFSNIDPEIIFGGDTMQLVWVSKFGKIKFLDEITTSYRKHEGGVWSSSNKLSKVKLLIKSRMDCLKIVEPILYIKFYKEIYFCLSQLRMMPEDSNQYIQDVLQQLQVYQLAHKNVFSLKKKLLIIINNFIVKNSLKAIIYNKIATKLINAL